MDHNTRFINHEDNLASRLLFWPMVTGILFVSTFVAFYGKAHAWKSWKRRRS